MFKEIKSSKTFQKALRKFKEFNFSLRTKLGLKKVKSLSIDYGLPSISTEQGIVILSSPSHLLISKLIHNQLSLFNISSEIILKDDFNGYNNQLYIIIGLYDLKAYPSDYIFFQTDSFETLTDQQLRVLQNAKFVLDYSLENINFLEKNSISYRNLFYMPIDYLDLGIDKVPQGKQDDYDKIINKGNRKLHFKGNAFSFYFNRFLLSNNIITYSQFLEKTNHPILDKKFVCLSLPETTSRTESFLKEEKTDVQILHGLRHYIGWIGCGLSYKYFMYLAKRQGFQYLIVCEDDVAFPKDFNITFDKILSYLDTNKDSWDLFSGFIADVHRETEVMNIELYQGLEFIHIDKLMSTVFNIYNKSFFDKLAKWNENNLNKETNTIDRFIESNESMRVVTILPFLVGHKEDLSSSIWNDIQNTDFNNLINKSSRLLDYKIKWYKRKNKLKSVFGLKQ